MTSLNWEHHRVSIPTALRLGGIAFAQVVDESVPGGAIRYVIDGQTFTPGEAADKYLEPNGEKGWVAR